MAIKLEGITFYTLTEVSKRLGITTQTTRAYIKSGKLKAIRVGRPILVSDKNLKDFLRAKYESTSVNITLQK
jgi:excisionase family DNA binding protein